MSKKLSVLISTIVGALSTVGIGFVTYFEPENATIINSSIALASSTIITILEAFSKNNITKKEKEDE